MNSDTDVRYFELTIVAASPATEIWLADTDGHLVQMEVGELRTSLLPGEYVVEFELGTKKVPGLFFWLNTPDTRLSNDPTFL